MATADFIDTQNSDLRGDTVVRAGSANQSGLTIDLPTSFSSSGLNEVVQLAAPVSPMLQGYRIQDPVVGPFRIGAALGSGSVAKVSLGTHSTTGQRVAIKSIKKMLIDETPDLLPKIRREIATMKRLDHPNIVKLFGVVDTPDKVHLIMELVTGGDLFDYVVANGRMQRDRALQTLAQLVDAVEHIHANAICHRDLKPENIMMDENGSVKIADFGMAQWTSSASKLLTSCGSPHYAAPEVVDGIPYDGRRADVWSLGVIFFVIFCGGLPFDSPHLPSLLEQVSKAQYTIPSTVPEDVADLMRRMMTRNPSQRIELSAIRDHALFAKTEYFSSPKKAPSSPQRRGSMIVPSKLRNARVLSEMESLGWGPADTIESELTKGEAAPAELMVYETLLSPKELRVLHEHWDQQQKMLPPPLLSSDSHDAVMTPASPQPISPTLESKALVINSPRSASPESKTTTLRTTQHKHSLSNASDCEMKQAGPHFEPHLASHMEVQHQQQEQNQHPQVTDIEVDSEHHAPSVMMHHAASDNSMNLTVWPVLAAISAVNAANNKRMSITQVSTLSPAPVTPSPSPSNVRGVSGKTSVARNLFRKFSRRISKSASAA